MRLPHCRSMALCVAAACLALACGIGSAAESAGEMHGMGDAFAAPGVALAWGVLRDSKNADAAVVVIRLATDPQVYPFAAAAGIDPFTSQREPRLAGTRTAGGIDIRVPRARFADFPRTEILLYGSATAPPSGAPRLTVFYLGVPDTTPEFATAAALDAYLSARIARLEATPGSKTP